MSEKISSATWKRTHYAGLLRPAEEGRDVVLCGWVQKTRDMGHLVFVDIRDREGLAQVVFQSDKPGLMEEAKKLRNESVVGVSGRVRHRSAVNTEIPTGEVEVEARGLHVFAVSKLPPFSITDPPQASEELRFKYRYLDLRRPKMQRQIRLRHDAALAVRNYMSGNGFLEIETPILANPTPEGARDYLVPSRMYKGRFYALPQSPQQFKQTLMISGFDRYFQIVRCFRDEDLRADRQPEFTQIDIEMSFIDGEEFYGLNEGLMEAIFALSGHNVVRPFPRLSYAEAMEKYGTDKPDLRVPLEMKDVTAVGRDIASDLIRGALDAGAEMKGLLIPGAANYSRGQLDKLNEKAKLLGAKGLFWIKKQDGWKSSLKLAEPDFIKIWAALGGGDGDLALFVADKRAAALKVLGEIRRTWPMDEAAKKNMLKFAWVTDFPLFKYNDEGKRWESEHHPFTSCHPDDIELLEKGKELHSIRSRSYDLVINGTEIGSGSIRIHDRKIQELIFKTIGISEEDALSRFGFLLDAFKYGAPPHGGVAFGLDRLMTFFTGSESIRDVIAFPKTQKAFCPMTSAPSAIDEKQLNELSIKIKK